MNDLNNVLLTGRLVQDAVLKYTPAGTAVLALSLAVNKSWKDKASGEWKEEVSYFEASLFGKQAEDFSRDMQKGTPVMVQGYLRQDRWTDREGKSRSTLKLILDDLRILKEKGRKGGADLRKEAAPAAVPEPDHFDDDGIPF